MTYPVAAVSASKGRSFAALPDQASATAEMVVPIAVAEDQQVRLWLPSGSYDVERSETMSSWTTLGSQSTTTSYTDTGLTNGTEYYYRVRQNDGSTTSPWKYLTRTPHVAEYPLDTYTETVAYGLHKLRSAMGAKAATVERVSDSVTADLEFDGDYVTPDSPITNRSDAGSNTTLLAFAGSGDVRVTAKVSHISGEPDLTATTNGWLIVENGEMVRSRHGAPTMRTDHERMEATGLTAIAEDNYRVLLHMEDMTGAHGNTEAVILQLGTGSKIQAPFSTEEGRTRAISNPSDIPVTANYGLAPIQYSLRSNSTTKQSLYNTNVEKEQTGTASTNTVSNVYLADKSTGGAKVDVKIATIVIGTHTTSQAQELAYQKGFQAGPVSRTYIGGLTDLPETYKWQQILNNFLSNVTSSDVAYPEVIDVTAPNVTVGNIDYTQFPSGNTVSIGSSEYTLASAPTLSGSDTVFEITESVSGVSIGDPVIPDPYWDGTFADTTELADLWNYWQEDGDDKRRLKAAARFDKGWYVFDDGGPATQSDLILQSCNIKEASPDTVYTDPALFEIKDATGDRRHAFVEIDLSGLTVEPTHDDLRFWVDSLSSEDSEQVYIATLTFEDLVWDDTTATWNSPPADLTGDPAYDDIEGITEPDEVDAYIPFELLSKIQTAYNNGASSITIGLYSANDQFADANHTDRTASLQGLAQTNPPVTDIYQKRGTTATDYVRVPDVHGSERQTNQLGCNPAAWYKFSLPLSGGAEGNPLNGHNEMLYRGLVTDLMNLTMLPWQRYDTYVDRDAYGQSYFVGGYMISLGKTLLAGGGDLLTTEEQQAVLDGATELFQICAMRDPKQVNGNLDTKVVEGAALMYKWADSLGTGEGGDLKEWALKASKRILLGLRDGQIDSQPFTISSLDGVFWLEGYVRESHTTETSYNERSLDHLGKAHMAVNGFADWDWLRPVLERMNEKIANIVYVDPDGVRSGPSAHSGRVGHAPMDGQGGPWSQRYMAYEFPEARFWLYSWSSGNPSRQIPDTNTALQNDVQAWVDSDKNLTYDSSVPENFEQNSPWPDDHPQDMPQSDWYSVLDGYLDADSADLYPYNHTTNFKAATALAPESGYESFWCLRGGTSPDRYAFTVSGIRDQGQYEGRRGPMVQAGYFEGVGTAILDRRVEYGTDPTGQLANVVWAMDDKATPTSVLMNDETFQDRTSWDGTTFSSSMLIDSSNQRGLENGDEIDIANGASWESAADFTEGSSPAGLSVSRTLTYTAGSSGTDQITKLWETIPLYVGHSVQQSTASLTVYYWDGSVYQQLAAGSSVTAQDFRIARDLDDGNGERYWWLRLDQSRKVSLRASSTTKREAIIHPLDLNLHPTGDGTAQDIPTTISYSYDATPIDPGYVPTGVSFSSFKPSATEVLPVGGYFPIEVDVTWHSNPDTGLFLDTSTDYAGDEAAATWTQHGQMSPESGTEGDGIYQYFEPSVPSGMTAIRLRGEHVDGTSTSVYELTSVSTTKQVEDTFTGDNDPIDGRVPDTLNNQSSDWYSVDQNEPCKTAGGIATTSGVESASEGGPGAIVDAGSTRCIVSADVNPGGDWSTPSGPGHLGVYTRADRSYFPYNRNWAVTLQGGDFKMTDQRLGDTDLSETLGLSASNTYRIEFQGGDNYEMGLLFDDTDTLLAKHVAHTGTARGGEAGFITTSVNFEADNFEVWTF